MKYWHCTIIGKSDSSISFIPLSGRLAVFLTGRMIVTCQFTTIRGVLMIDFKNQRIYLLAHFFR